ncbi:MAG: hypothetical protein DDT29_01827 [Dehalococcoidia bacterium]|nr:hypothetical protein [Bacillota bacterium]
MEKVIVLVMVFISIGLLIWYIVRTFKDKGSCCGCERANNCDKANIDVENEDR